MNEFLIAFWHRSLWQQLVPVWIGMLLSSIAYLHFYWQEMDQHISTLEHEINTILVQSQHINLVLQQRPSLKQLEQTMVELTQQIRLTKQTPQHFIHHLQPIIARSGVVLNHLRPTHSPDSLEKHYSIEIQGGYSQIYRFIHALVTPSPTQSGLFSGIKFKPHHGYLTATLAVSFIKDDMTHEQ